MSEQATTSTMTSTAEVATPQAARYLTQLCKHFGHRRPVTHDDAAGLIAFDAGDCRLRAEAGTLTVSVEAADEPKLAQLEDVVARHLVRFAFREDVQVNWRRGGT